MVNDDAKLNSSQKRERKRKLSQLALTNREYQGLRADSPKAQTLARRRVGLAKDLGISEYEAANYREDPPPQGADAVPA